MVQGKERIIIYIVIIIDFTNYVTKLLRMFFKLDLPILSARTFSSSNTDGF